ncbi:MAG: NAD(P)-dependent oxidoreductase [Burkholderiales bacterium]
MKSTGVIGLGVLGKPVAERLLKAGFGVAVFDVRAEPVAALKTAGAIACATPAEVAKHSELIVSLVSDQAQTDAIVSGPGGILETLQPGTIVAIGSTLTPAVVRDTAKAIAAKGGETLDIPISGGYLAAYDGTLSLMVGGAPATLERARPALETFANQITLAGDVGAGQAAKLAHQLVFATNVMALLEGLSLGARAGVDPDVMKQILKAGIANSSVLQLWHDLGPRWKDMLNATAPDAPLPNMRKDLHLVLELAKELGVTLPVATEASRTADTGRATGHDDPRL